jgi:hypothetical protein
LREGLPGEGLRRHNDRAELAKVIAAVCGPL